MEPQSSINSNDSNDIKGGIHIPKTIPLKSMDQNYLTWTIWSTKGKKNTLLNY